MTVNVRDREAEAIAKLVELVLMDPDPRTADHNDAEIAAARVAAEWVRRDGRYTARRSEPVRPSSTPRPKGDNPTLADAKDRVRRRSAGCCEVAAKGCTGRCEHVHHRRRRSQGGTDDEGNLLAACRSCHDYVHDHPAESFARGWLLHALPVTP